MSEKAEAFRFTYPQPVTLPTWALDLLCVDHILSEKTNKCPGCDVCELTKLAAHEAFVLLPVKMRYALCLTCVEVDLDPSKVFGWKPEDSLRSGY